MRHDSARPGIEPRPHSPLPPRDAASRRHRKLAFARLLLVALLGTGCGARLPNLQQLAPLPAGPICRVAVLPFGTESKYLLADTIAYKVFLAEFTAASNYEVAQEGDIGKIYQQLLIFPGQQPSLEQLRILASRLDAQLLITGNVIEMRGNSGENPLLVLNLQIHDGHTGGALWSTYHRREGADYRKVMHFGNINTVTSLSRRVSREVVELWSREGLTKCEP